MRAFITSAAVWAVACIGGSHVYAKDEQARIDAAESTSASRASRPLRPFTTRDAVEMAYFGDLFSVIPGHRTSEGAFSPDGRYFVQLTHRGVLPAGVTESTIWLFETERVHSYVKDDDHERRPPEPTPLVTMRNAVNGPINEFQGANVIMAPKWSADGEQLAFLACPDDETHGLFVVSLADRRLERISPTTHDVVDFGWGAGSLVYSARPAFDEAETFRSAGPGIPDVQIGTGSSLTELVYPNWRRSTLRDGPATLWIAGGGQVQQAVERSTGKPILLNDTMSPVFAVSPNGRHVVVSAFAELIPSEWEQYPVLRSRLGRPFVADDRSSNVALAGTSSRTYSDRARQYVLIDLIEGRKKPLVSAPIADAVRGFPGEVVAAWGPDGSSVALTNSYLPLASSARLRTGDQPCKVVVVRLRIASPECIERYDIGDTAPGAPHLRELVWDRAGEWIALTYELRKSGHASREQKFFRRLPPRWVALQAPPASKLRPVSPVTLDIVEGLNRPPTLWVEDVLTKRRRVLLDPNPQLADVELGEARLFRWRDAFGRELEGGLMLPRGYDPNVRYPLVIQTHGFNPHEFLRTGGLESGFAARALAGRGVMVLQAEEPRSPANGTVREAIDDGMMVYLAAIDQLSKDGLVDDTRVGLVGTSRTGMYVMAALTNSPGRFAAAAFAEGDPGTLGAYLATLDYLTPGMIDRQANFYAGTKPYGHGLEQWIRHAPGFNTEKITAPLLISTSDPQSLILQWDLYAMLRDQGKGVELLHIRTGRHNLMKPMHRFISQEMHTDWFDFWLRDAEDPDPSKFEQYQRWRALRTARSEQTSRSGRRYREPIADDESTPSSQHHDTKE